MKNKKNILLAFAISFFLGCCIVLPNIIANEGIFDLTADLNIQQIPFLKLISNSIRNGNILWNWNNGLGSDFISTFSFYNLFSPFNLLIYIFNPKYVEFLIGPVLILKYAVAGTSSFLFLSRYVKKTTTGILGSVLYAFSGFQLTNTLFYHFHDFVALFPLLLYSVDNLVYDNKKCWLSLSVALLAITNWFFAIGAGVFIIIYILIKYLTGSYKFKVRNFVQIIVEGILGLCISAFILLPSFYYTINNPRLSSGWNISNLFIYPDKVKYLNIIKSIIFPPDAMNHQSLFNLTDFTSLELYLPFVGIVLMITYVIKNKKNWLSILILTLLTMIFIPILNSSFFAFQYNYYARWFYIPILFFSLASVKAIEENKNYSLGLLIQKALLILLMIGIYICKQKNIQIIYNEKSLIFSIIVVLLSTLILEIIKNKKDKTFTLLICVSIFTIIWGNFTIYNYKWNNFKTISNYKQFLAVEDEIKINEDIRTNSSSSCTYNYGYLSNVQNIKEWNSNIEGRQFELYNSLGYIRDVASIIPIEDITINNILAVKYIITCNDEDLSSLGYKYLSKTENYKIYENINYKEFGYYPSAYISENEFNKLPIEKRKEIIENTVILDNQQIENYKDIISKNTKYKTNEFSINNNGFKSIINTNNNTLAIYSIPYSKGWSAYNNGEKIKIEEVNNGMMAIRINSGENNINFEYMTPGLKLGITISTMSSIILIIYTIFLKKGKKYEN